MTMLATNLLQELDMEAVTTRRVLERIPQDQFGWRPAERSRTLGELAQHIATNPGAVCRLAATNPAQAPTFGQTETPPTSTAALLISLEASLDEARRILGGMSDSDLVETWRLMAGDHQVMAMPRIAFLRSVLLNHWYHHRGQLTVYLRELDVPVPSIYGPSADENPFDG